ncbi:2,4-dihydroxyhept-2-ene-1,7-dioic acid aldolase [bacterium]|jgi:2-keto-3-deoxy-L-rhamnonate aldolase RhmA|nr:2,4-dihydroxyhept-2-ene-1,7-dioic acid aldolase [bacterium]
MNTLKKKLYNNKISLGSWITIGSTVVAEIFAKAGFDWLVIDLEHTTIDINTAGELIRVIDLCGVTPLVRLTSNKNDQIKRVMDAGAHGVVVPMVNSAGEAKQAVNATRYAPEGVRGVGLARAQGYGATFNEYLRWQKDNPIVIVQIEHKDAIVNIDEILSVPGIDGLIIGPYDLSCSLGIPGQFDNSEFVDIMASIRDSGLRHNCPVGLHIVEPDLDKMNDIITQGYTFIAYSVDIRMLDLSARNGVMNCASAISRNK